MVFFVGIAAAICLGLGYVLQQRVAARSKESSGHAVRLLLDLMHQRAWWAGIIVMIIGQLLGGLALGLASVAVVEPLLSASLLFAFVIAAFLSNQRVRWHEILGALLVSAALGVFLAVGDPLSSDHPKANRAVVVLAIAVVAGVVATLVIDRDSSRAGRPLRPLRDRCRPAVRPPGRQHPSRGLQYRPAGRPSSIPPRMGLRRDRCRNRGYRDLAERISRLLGWTTPCRLSRPPSRLPGSRSASSCSATRSRSRSLGWPPKPPASPP